MNKNKGALKKDRGEFAHQRAFSTIPLPPREEKPRQKGLTMLIDWGIDLEAQNNIVQIAGPFIDIAKIAVGISGLLPLDLLQRKIESYRNNDILAFPGGMYLEYAISLGRMDAYFKHCAEAGFKLVEVSDNVDVLPKDVKQKVISNAIKNYGFKVLGETGSKVESSSVQHLIDDVKACLDAGAWKVLVEALELYDTALKEDVIQELTAALPVDKLIIEIPGAWVPNVHEFDRHSMIRRLIEWLGPDVNLGNIESSELLMVETLRRKHGVAGYH